MDFLAYPAWVLIGLAGLVLGFLGAGVLGSGIIGAMINIILGWNTAIIPSSVDWGSSIPEWIWYLFSLPSIDGTTMLYLLVVGGLIGAMASYLGAFIRKKMEGKAI